MKTKQYLAIDIGGTSVKLGIVDETGTVLAKAEESVSFDGYETPILTTVCKAAKAFVEAQNLSPAALVGVGVSATGQIDSRKGIVAGTCGNFPNHQTAEFINNVGVYNFLNGDVQRAVAAFNQAAQMGNEAAKANLQQLQQILNMKKK